MLTDERLHNSLKVTFIYVFVSTPLQLAVALAIALQGSAVRAHWLP